PGKPRCLRTPDMLRKARKGRADHRVQTSPRRKRGAAQAESGKRQRVEHARSSAWTARVNKLSPKCWTLPHVAVSVAHRIIRCQACDEPIPFPPGRMRLATVHPPVTML